MDSLASDYKTFLFARAKAGGFGGIVGAVVLSIVGDIIPFFRRDKATGIMRSSYLFLRECNWKAIK